MKGEEDGSMHNEIPKDFEKRKEEGEWEQKYNGWGEFVQDILYACMKLSQKNPLVLLIYNKTEIKFFKNLVTGFEKLLNGFYQGYAMI